MGSTEFDIKKFTGNIDFRQWRLKMRALMAQQGVEEALNGEYNMTTVKDPESNSYWQRPVVL